MLREGSAKGNFGQALREVHLFGNNIPLVLSGHAASLTPY